ncbi:uncharacterized protein [Watersipora subatra]|uniref:uncharacterized protein n=1 Tax=Watersipora subatra TaxID=2589382 RepID=UPI00355B3F23
MASWFSARPQSSACLPSFSRSQEIPPVEAVLPSQASPVGAFNSGKSYSPEAGEQSNVGAEKPIPAELATLISSLCKENYVQAAMLVRDPDELNRLIIIGKNAGSLEPFLPCIRQKYANFDILTHNMTSFLYTQHKTSLKAARQTPRMFGAPDWTMEGEDQATIEMLVQADDMATVDIDKPTCTYAVVPAHMAMTGKQKNEFANSDNRIGESRLEVEGRTTSRRYSICINNDLLHEMGHPPVFCYRHWFNREFQCANSSRSCVPGEECHHMYMNDVALLLITNHREHQLQTYLEKTEPKKVRWALKQINTSAELIDLHRQKQRIVVKNSRGCMINVEQPNLTDSRIYAKHILFRLEPTGHATPPKLIAGDCGCIVYLEDSEGVLQPFGLFVGIFDCKLKGPPLYQAIVLNQAFRDLELDYPHRLRDIRLYHLESFTEGRTRTRTHTGILLVHH